MSLGLPGLRIGHWHDPVGLTGCTVVLPQPGNVTSVSVRGGGPGTRETDLLEPTRHLAEVSAILLTGGSAFGLAAASGVAEWCEQAGIGYARYGRPIPLVPAAVIFDLPTGDWNARPGPAEGRAACERASEADGSMGNVGAGMGASVGKTAGPAFAMKGGLGHASVSAGAVVVGALAVVNAGGDVLDERGEPLAGTRYPGGAPAAIRARALGNFPVPGQPPAPPLGEPPAPGGNTTIAVVVTNARLDKVAVHATAARAHDGMARAILPAHTTFDGDTVFAVAQPEVEAEAELVALLAEEALAAAIRAAMRAAASVPGLPGLADRPVATEAPSLPVSPGTREQER